MNYICPQCKSANIHISHTTGYAHCLNCGFVTVIVEFQTPKPASPNQGKTGKEKS